MSLNEFNKDTITRLDFSSDVYDFLNQPFFKENGIFSHSKINTFLFLFSRPEKKASENIQYFDIIFFHIYKFFNLVVL